jgi:hypothetical protein
LALKAYKKTIMMRESEIKRKNRKLAFMKSALGGGQKQGILMTSPAALVIPSQLPLPVGFRPA